MGAQSIEEALASICRFLYDELRDPAGERACALVRSYKTHPYGELPLADREFARRLIGSEPNDATRCLTLLGTVGDESKWNDRRRSKGHRAIPLPNPEMVAKAPMIAQLIKQLGLDVGVVLSPSRDVIADLEGRTYGVFHVENALGSPYIPAQDEFVKPHNIRSVVGFGGLLKGGDLFALIIFARVPIAKDAADRFRTIALDVKSVLFQMDQAKVFNS